MGYSENDKPNKARKILKRPGKKEKYEKYTVEEILSFPVLAIEERGITKKTATAFGVRTELDEDGETPIAHYFPYSMDGELVGWKKRDLTKHKHEDYHFTTIGTQGVKCDLFGTKTARQTGGKKVFICEGEYDAMILHQTLKEHSSKNKPSVLSISSGTANAVQNIGQKQNMSFLKKFEQTVLVFDGDSATVEEKKKKIMKGKEATAAVYGLIPEVMVASLPDDKDPCEVYKEEGSEALFWMAMKPIRYTPEGFVRYEDIREKAIELPKVGKPWPWPTMTKKTLGRRLGEGLYIGAGVKMGKSELANKLIEHITKTEKDRNGDPQKVAVFKFEEQPDETLKKVAGKFYRKDFVNPEKIIFIGGDGTELEGKEVDVWGEKVRNRESFYTQEELEEAIDTVGPSLILYNNYGRCNWDELKGAIRHAVLVEHVEDVFIDPITRLTAGMSASEANEELERFADEISKMSQDLGFTYYCFCHLKAPPAGQKPHEAGGRIYSSQFRGSRAMMQCCHYMIGLEGNKDPDLDEKTRNTRYLIILDDRKYGRTAKIPLFYDVDTGDFDEPLEGFLESDCQTLAEFKEQYPDGINNEDF
jgi:twinkle protein